MAIPKPTSKAGDEDEEGRERSTIKFPYMDLDDAIAVALAVHQTGGSSCAYDQLAAKLDLSMKSSGFNVRLATARLFGLIEAGRGENDVTLTPLGQTIIDPSQVRGAKVQAFLTVPLYAKLVEHYRGKILPPAAALEREMASMGVAQKQTDKARQAFERSAKSAGYFEFGPGKLVQPNVTPPSLSHYTAPQSEVPVPMDESRGKNGGPPSGRGGPPVDPIIVGLLARLPKSGEVWPEAERKLWLDLLEGSFRLIYKESGA